MLYKVIGVFILLISFLFFGQQVFKNISELRPLFSDYEVKTQELITPVIYIFVVINGSIIWHVLMKGFNGFKKPLIISAHIFLVSQFAKYIPGNVGHHVGRIYLTKKYNYDTLQVLAAMAIENLLPMTASVLFSFYIVREYQELLEYYVKNNINYNIILFILISAIILFFWLFIIRKKIFNLILKYVDPNIRFHNVMLAFILSMFNFLALGFILWILIKSYSIDANTNFFLITGIFSIAWLLGFITPGSPGGIGVREALLIGFLTPIYGNAMAIWLSIMLRIITTLGDGLAFFVGLAFTPFIKRFDKL